MKLTHLLLIALLIFPSLMVIACGDDDDDDDDSTTEADDDETEDGTDDDDDDDDDDNDDVTTAQIDQATLEDKIRGSWVGQMAGVTWGATTEFQYMGQIIPEDQVPDWTPDRINRGYLQDDIYVEIPFMIALQQQGIFAGWDTFGPLFRDSNYPMAHANLKARSNLRHDIPAPDSGHYLSNQHCDDIDWQIEADFVGTLCPGLVNTAIDLAFSAGHVMNYGDGVLGGVFMAAMHAKAFFANDLMEIIEAGRKSLPEGSKYRTVVEDVIGWYSEGKSWEETWCLLQDKWGEDDRCPTSDYYDPLHNIDAKLNGAYVLIGLLWGDGDFKESMEISMRCGQDSDCNPSSVGAILGNWQGLSQIPDEFKEELDLNRQFIFSDHTLDNLIEANLEVVNDILTEKDAALSGDTWTIPVEEKIIPPILEQWPKNENEPPALLAGLLSQDANTAYFSAEATDSDGVLEYEWYFGDLCRAKGETVEHTYNASGSYTVIVYVTDAVGNTSWETILVTVP